MAVDKPTVEQFLTRFPEFANEDEEKISAVIDEAAASISDSWTLVDQKPAIQYLAAHLLSTDGASDGSLGGRNIASESFGPISVSYEQGGSAESNGYASTAYGQGFIRIRNRNVAGIVVIP